MQPDWQVELGHGGKDWLELRLVERLSSDIGVDQHTARAEVLDGAVSFRHRAFDGGQAKRRGKGRKTLWIFAAQFRHRVVGDARELQADFGRSDVLDRRIGQRDDLTIIAELIHLLETGIEIEQLGDAAQTLTDVFEFRRHARHFLEVAVWKDVAVDVYDRAHNFAPESLGASSRCRCNGSACQPNRSAIRPQRPFGARSITTMATTPIINI